MREVKTYIKICCHVRGHSTNSNIVIHHVSSISRCGKTHCTPACGFTSHVEGQLVIVIGPLQLEISITRINAGVIQCIDFRKSVMARC